MADEPAASITFTEILYGVVIANALTKLSFGVTVRNGMILLAIVVVLSDWVEYSAGLAAADRDESGVAIFVADMLVLLVWNVLTIVPADRFVWYVAALVAFFAAQHVWELVVGRFAPVELVATPTTGLILGYGAVAAIVTADLLDTRLALGLCLALFVAGKTPAWRRIRRMDAPIRL